MDTAVQVYLELEGKGLVTSKPKSGFLVGSTVQHKMEIPAISQPRPLARPLENEVLIKNVYDSLIDPSIIRLSFGYLMNDYYPWPN